MKFLFHKIVVLVFLLLPFNTILAQSKYPLYIIDNDTIQYEKDSLAWKKKDIEQKKQFQTYSQSYEQIFLNSKSTIQQANDSTLKDRHNYYNNSLLGNHGLPSYSLQNPVLLSHLGFQYYNLPYSKDMFDETQGVFYNSPLPFTSLFAVAGQRQEQMLKFLHTQNVKNKVNITLQLNRYKCDGFYQKQLGFVNNVLFSSNFKTKKENWGYYFYILHNKLKHQENGGITSDSTIKSDPFGGKDLIPVYLSSAKRNNKTFDISLTQWLRFFNNTTSNHKIFYTAKYKSNYYQLIDSGADSLYYSPNSFTSNNLNDSTSFKQLINDTRYVYELKKEKGKFNLDLGYLNEINWLKQPKQDTLLTNDIAIANANYVIGNHLFSAKSTYCFNGYNNNNYNFYLAYGFANTMHTLVLSAKTDKTNPVYQISHVKTNTNNWDLSINAQKTNALDLFYALHKQKLSFIANLSNYNNYIYIDSISKNFNSSINYIKLILSKDFKLSKFNFSAKVIYQKSTEESVLSVPEFTANAQLYYENDLFKKNLRLQIGAQAYYLSSYYGRNYNVSLNQFTVQNQIKQGNYTFIDFFINFRIKPVCFFVKVEHLNQGLMGSNYNLVPNYYQNSRALKFGLNWVFWD